MVNVKIYNTNASLIFVKNYGKMQAGTNIIQMSDFVKSLQKNNVYLLNIETEKETINTKFEVLPFSLQKKKTSTQNKKKANI